MAAAPVLLGFAARCLRDSLGDATRCLDLLCRCIDVLFHSAGWSAERGDRLNTLVADHHVLFVRDAQSDRSRISADAVAHADTWAGSPAGVSGCCWCGLRRLYPDRLVPKNHLALRHADQYRYLQAMPNCFVLERKHREVRRTAASIFGTFEQSLSLTVLNTTLSAKHARGDVLHNAVDAPWAVELFAAVTPCEQVRMGTGVSAACGRVYRADMLCLRDGRVGSAVAFYEIRDNEIWVHLQMRSQSSEILVSITEATSTAMCPMPSESSRQPEFAAASSRSPGLQVSRAVTWHEDSEGQAQLLLPARCAASEPGVASALG